MSSSFASSMDNAHEGVLVMLRGVLGLNKRLENVCKSLGFDSSSSPPLLSEFRGHPV
jgi:hypothetical protein